MKYHAEMWKETKSASPCLFSKYSFPPPCSLDDEKIAGHPGAFALRQFDCVTFRSHFRRTVGSEKKWNIEATKIFFFSDVGREIEFCPKNFCSKIKLRKFSSKKYQRAQQQLTTKGWSLTDSTEILIHGN